MDGEQVWRVPAAPEVIGELRNDIVAFADQSGCKDPPLEDLKLAVSEAITNAVLHAYRAQSPGTIEVAVRTEPSQDRVVVRVRDHGVGMKPRDDSPGAGFGLSIISALTQDLAVREPPDGGTELCMSFALR